jgi:hypothetical protein
MYVVKDPIAIAITSTYAHPSTYFLGKGVFIVAGCNFLTENYRITNWSQNNLYIGKLILQ